ELEIELAANPNADELLETLYHNYGLAGEVYSQYLVNNLDAVTRLIHKTADKFSKDVGAVSKERFWVNVVAVNMAGGVIAQKLGLHDYNMGSIYKWCVERFKQMRETTHENVTSCGDMLGEFINGNYSSYLIID